MIDNKNIGGSLDDFLAEDGLLEETEELAIKEILADQIRVAMKEEGLTKSAMAARMRTSRQALDRLLDPKNTGVTLHTMQNAARALGRRLSLSLQ
jgi:antitoxin HicB